MLNRLLFLLPRILAGLFILFLALFALDTFSESYSFWETVLALLIHLIPAASLLAVLVVAWCRERLGGLLFIALGLIFGLALQEQTEGIVFLLVVTPTFLIGLLFLVSALTGESRCGSGSTAT